LYKKYLKRMLVLFLLIFLLLNAISYFVDPYGYKSREEKFIKNLSMFNKPIVTNTKINSDGYFYLIGSSRVARVDPNLIEKLTGKNTHNLKIDGATLSENTFIASKLKKHGKYFIYSFDAFSVNQTRENFNEIKNRSETYKVELNKNLWLRKYFNSDLLIRSLQHIIKSSRNEDLYKQYSEENYRKSNFSYDLALNNSGVLNNLHKSNFSDYAPYSDQEITKLAKLGTKNDIFIIFPKYMDYYYLFANYQNIENKYFSSIKTLVKNTDAKVWSFYGVNSITKDKRNFIDNGWHFKPEISTIIFRDIFEPYTEGIEKIGFLITKDNVNDYLLALEEEVNSIQVGDI
jgi:hypothetical protein